MCEGSTEESDTKEKMGRTIYAEEPLRAYLASLAKPDGYIIGLILGQVRLFFYFLVSRLLCLTF